MLGDDTFNRLIHLLATVGHDDYSNALLYGMPDCTLFDCKRF